MSGALVPRGGAKAAARADDSNRYKALQTKLERLARALGSVSGELEALLARTRANAGRAERMADQVSQAGLDGKYAELTRSVSHALNGAGSQVQRLAESAAEVTDATRAVKKTHARLYQQLDDIRSGRREKTPKPGFFAQ